MPDVRKQIAISDGSVKRPRRRDCQRFGGVVIPGSGVRPDDRGRAVSGPARLGPSRRSARPLRRHRAGRRFRSPDRGRDGRGVVGVRARHRFARPGRRARVRDRDRRGRPLLRAQARRYAGAARRRASAASRSSSTTAATSPGAAIGCFPGARPAATSASAAAASAWRSGSPAMRHAEHVAFLGGGARVRTSPPWELQAAALELEGQPAPGAPGREREPAPARRPRRRRRSTSRSCWPTTRSAP